MILLDAPDPKLIPMEELTAMIRAGWGSVRRDQIPDNWREVPGPGEEFYSGPRRRREKPNWVSATAEYKARSAKLYRERNRERVLAQKRRYREENRERIREQRTEWDRSRRTAE